MHFVKFLQGSLIFSSISVGARVGRSGWEDLYGRPGVVGNAHHASTNPGLKRSMVGYRKSPHTTSTPALAPTESSIGSEIDAC